jgi:hypothetical protein
MVAPCYFRRGWGDNHSKNYSQDEILEAKERLIEEFTAYNGTHTKIRKIYPNVPAFLGNMYNELKSIFFC